MYALASRFWIMRKRSRILLNCDWIERLRRVRPKKGTFATCIGYVERTTKPQQTRRVEQSRVSEEEVSYHTDSAIPPKAWPVLRSQ
jgi:hypothetical protein